MLLDVEPPHDAADAAAAQAALAGSGLVVSLTSFLDAAVPNADVLLPIAPFTETAGSFVNAEGRIQSFHAVVKPLGEARPAWKVLRVMANLLELPGMDFETAQDVLARCTGGVGDDAAFVPAARLSNATSAAIDSSAVAGDPVTASIYGLDALVRRAPSLQSTADARQAREGAAA